MDESNRGTAAIMARVRERGMRVERVNADLVLDLTRADGAQARLHASLWMERPDLFRVRSTKWGFLVCDVIVRGDDASALLSSVVREQAQSSAEASVALARVLGSLVGWRAGGGDPFEHFEVVEERDDAIVVRVLSDGAHALEWTLARSDGRPLRVRRLEGDQVTGVLACEQPVDVDGVPLPTRLRFESAMGRIDVEVKKPRVNEPANDRAFDVPKDAERLVTTPPAPP